MASSPLLLTIDRLSYGPAGVGRADGKVVFAPETAPGDEVEVLLDEEKRGYAVGHVVSVRKPSPHRRHPPCPYVRRCGGCPWQHIEYAEQLRAKELLVGEQLRRIGGLSDIPLLPIIPSPQEWRYRHRIRLRVRNNTRVGFSPARSHEVVEIDSCLVAWEGVETHLRIAREWVRSLRTPLRQVELALSDPEALSTQQPRVVLSGAAEGAFRREDHSTCQRLLTTHPSVGGLRLWGKGWRRAWGETSRVFTDGGEHTLAVRDGAFTQVNTAANHALVTALLQLSDVRSDDRVIELYCGAGNFSAPLARRARELIGVEQDGEAIASARMHVARAGILNARFVHAAARVGVGDLLARETKGDIVVLDPPRAGAADIVDSLARFGARAIVYVSCDPATLARDLRRLPPHGYRLHAVQPLDMFPQTYHVETIAVSVLTC